MEQIKVNKLKLIKNPSLKSARELLRSITQEGYNVSIKNRDFVFVKIQKYVPMSLR